MTPNPNGQPHESDANNQQNADDGTGEEPPHGDLREQNTGAGRDPNETVDAEEAQRVPQQDKRRTNDAPSPDDDDLVDPDDLTVTRGGDGQLIAEPRPVGNGTMKFYPMTYGDVTEFFGDGQRMDVGADAMAELFDEFVAEPDLDAYARKQGFEEGLCGEYVESMKPLVPRDMLMGLMDVSGIDIDEMQMDPEETRAQMSVRGN